MKINIKLNKLDNTTLELLAEKNIFVDQLCRHSKKGNVIVSSIDELKLKIEDLSSTHIGGFQIHVEDKLFAQKNSDSEDVMFNDSYGMDLSKKFSTKDDIGFTVFKSDEGTFSIKRTDTEEAYLGKESQNIKNIKGDEEFRSFSEAMNALNFYMVDMSSNLTQVDTYHISVNDAKYAIFEKHGFNYNSGNDDAIEKGCKLISKEDIVIRPKPEPTFEEDPEAENKRKRGRGSSFGNN